MRSLAVLIEPFRVEISQALLDAERRQAMSYSISTLLTRNFHDVFGDYHRTERCTTRVRYTLQREPFADSSRNFIVHSHRMAGIVLPEGLATRRLPQLLRPAF